MKATTDSMTKGEKRLMYLLAQSASNETIARKMGWSKSKVTARLHELYLKFGFTASNPRVEAGCHAIRQGF